MTKPEQMSLFGDGPVLDLSPKQINCWRYTNSRKCDQFARCKEWSRKYDNAGNHYNCCEMFRCGTCADCETPAKRFFSGECEHLEEWIQMHGQPWREAGTCSQG